MNWQQLDSLSYQNRLRFLPPEHKLLFASALILLVLTGHEWLQMAICIWMGVWVIGYARIPVRFYFGFLLLSLSFFVLGLPALLLEATRAETAPVTQMAVAWHVGPYLIYVPASAISKVWVLFWRTMASLACFSFILFTVPFAEILQVLRKLRLPVIVTDLLMIMYRFIFVLLGVSHQLWIAQRSRGGHRGFRATMRDIGGLAAQLFVRAMRKYDALYKGMAARGFGESLQVLSLHSHSRSRRYEWESIAGCVLLILLEWWTGG
ncbi:MULTISPECIES: cobalt ECF transporter T component CbiQ [Brevibacillus]|jgi:cobalt/nickel transport system permease protein|uniref:Cobalt ECF transporter T component CbiQ n=1 Tax=Brevibacillus parabrevis TaxID=54914 RepID=A0A4Y3PQA5_BREPA|nr:MULTISPECIES: cobalt ECF transporter T component CbiQ [Brevibacillus]MBU8713902.1 cobalt ECF transporter T component CbiQ [Brevibacillus parabrevis]MDH6350639.1 cobalt/nickel transport system permease protein [Brevibacillus sp. 1238]MED2255461.1 cobalt ECF transporter T component CbiQ [Brevibacillus parabrevis]RNB94826.1 cobalt ECF transporter T component CbiQ [Brevibacillus parabrevis]WDV94578.1 cobalt ECF transporter T component CbiQ [Brevibacillus parabrevis]